MEKNIDKFVKSVQLSEQKQLKLKKYLEDLLNEPEEPEKNLKNEICNNNNNFNFSKSNFSPAEKNAPPKELRWKMIAVTYLIPEKDFVHNSKEIAVCLTANFKFPLNPVYFVSFPALPKEKFVGYKNESVEGERTRVTVYIYNPTRIWIQSLNRFNVAGFYFESITKIKTNSWEADKTTTILNEDKSSSSPQSSSDSAPSELPLHEISKKKHETNIKIENYIKKYCRKNEFKIFKTLESRSLGGDNFYWNKEDFQNYENITPEKLNFLCNYLVCYMSYSENPSEAFLSAGFANFLIRSRTPVYYVGNRIEERICGKRVTFSPDFVFFAGTILWIAELKLFSDRQGQEFEALNCLKFRQYHRRLLAHFSKEPQPNSISNIKFLGLMGINYETAVNKKPGCSIKFEILNCKKGLTDFDYQNDSDFLEIQKLKIHHYHALKLHYEPKPAPALSENALICIPPANNFQEQNNISRNAPTGKKKELKNKKN